MKVLFLGGNLVKTLADWLREKEEVVYTEDKITIDFVKQVNPEFIVSYNYKYLISEKVISFVDGKAVNLHISYLPWNRGAHPNVWSFLEDSPKGVSIHHIDEGVDTGDIIVQKKVYIDEDKETLKSSYEKLHRELQNLFKENWEKIKRGKIKPKKQIGGGGIHYKRDYKLFEPLIREKRWDIQIRELKEKFRAWRCGLGKLCKLDRRGEKANFKMAQRSIS